MVNVNPVRICCKSALKCGYEVVLELSQDVQVWKAPTDHSFEKYCCFVHLCLEEREEGKVNVQTSESPRE